MLSITLLLLKIVGMSAALVVVVGLRRAVAGVSFMRSMRAYAGLPLARAVVRPAPAVAPDLTARRVG